MKEVWEKMKEANKDERLYIANKSFNIFAMYYFSDYFTYKLAPFHYDFFQDCHDLVDNKIREVAWIAFRESGKTSIAKLFIIWLICTNRRKYINVDSLDKENAERILFDVAFELVNNKRLQNDFGVMFSRNKAIDEIKQNRINNFVCENGVRVEAHSTQESVRGRIHLNQRPDALILDDIENNKTKDSEAYTKQVADHISEAMAGLSTDGFMLYLGNFLTEYGNVQHIITRAKNDTGIRVRNIPVMIDNKPTWESKYALTDEEAGKTGKVSIEDKQRQLGSLVFSYEMMNKPIDEMTAEFKKEFAQFDTEEHLKKLDTNCYITIDSAVSEKESADFTGVCINRVSTENKWYITTYRLKYNSKDLIDHLFYLHKTYKPVFLGLEETTFTMAIQPFLQEEMRKRQVFFSVTPVKHKGIQKELRIRGLIPRWESRSIFLVGDNPELLDEMRVFPNGQHDDCISEGTLILTKKGQVLIKNVCVGDYVMTRNGYQKVVKVWDKGFKKVIKKLGIIATPDHKIITKEGVIPLCNVKLSDILYIWNEKLSCIEEKDIIDTRNQNLDNTEYIMCDTTNGKKHQFIYTDRFGLITLGRYLKDFIYTIKIITLSIIKLITWNSSQLQTTPLNIQTDQKEKKWQGKMLLKIIRKCKKLLNFGDIAWKVENGIHFIREQVLINQNELFVQSVEQKQLNTEQMENIALKNVAINSNSEIIVQDIQIIGRRKVYDLMVENNHEFFANGILVHNCVDAMSMQLQQARPPFRKPMYPEERKAEVNIAI